MEARFLVLWFGHIKSSAGADVVYVPAIETVILPRHPGLEKALQIAP
jgi:hypothetical protein